MSLRSDCVNMVRGELWESGGVGSVGNWVEGEVVCQTRDLGNPTPDQVLFSSIEVVGT